MTISEVILTILLIIVLAVPYACILYGGIWFLIDTKEDRKSKSKTTSIIDYRKNNPDCDYCNHKAPGFTFCMATNKRMSKRQARKCPCYKAKVWGYNTENESEE